MLYSYYNTKTSEDYSIDVSDRRVRHLVSQHKVNLQSEENHYFIGQSLPQFAIAFETIDGPTQALLHKYSRFWYITDGLAKVNIQGVVHTLEKGDFVGILPWQYTEVIEVIQPLHYFVIVYERDIVNLVLKNELMALGIKEDILASIYDHVKIRVPADEESHFVFLFTELKKECDIFTNTKGKKAEIATVMASTLMIQLMIRFYRLSCNNQDHHIRQQHKVQIFHYLYYHLNDNLTLKQLSSRFHLSESAIAKYIEQTLGLTFTQLITTMKIARITNMLKYSDETVQELAIYLGYVDAAHISKFFKAKTGTTLAKFRESMGSRYDMVSWNAVPEMVSYVIDHYFEDLTKESICHRFDFPKQHLNAAFDFYSGLSFSKFVSHIRMIKAVEAMFITEKCITDIAYEVGYQSIKTFNRQFQKYYHMCPVEFRKSIQIQSGLL